MVSLSRASFGAPRANDLERSAGSDARVVHQFLGSFWRRDSNRNAGSRIHRGRRDDIALVVGMGGLYARGAAATHPINRCLARDGLFALLADPARRICALGN